MMVDTPKAIPRPLVRTNQWFIVISVILALATPFRVILALPLLVGLSGLLFHFNPIMKLARNFLHQPMSEYAMEDADQQRFNQTIAVTCLALALISFQLGAVVLGYVFSVIVGLAAFIAILGFCIGCFIHYQWTQMQHRRATR